MILHRSQGQNRLFTKKSVSPQRRQNVNWFSNFSNKAMKNLSIKMHFKWNEREWSVRHRNRDQISLIYNKILFTIQYFYWISSFDKIFQSSKTSRHNINENLIKWSRITYYWFNIFTNNQISHLLQIKVVLSSNTWAHTSSLVTLNTVPCSIIDSMNTDSNEQNFDFI